MAERLDLTVMNIREEYKGGELMKEEKLEQLRKVFKTKIQDVIRNAKKRQLYFDNDPYIQNIADNLVYEVKIRIGGEI